MKSLGNRTSWVWAGKLGKNLFLLKAPRPDEAYSAWGAELPPDSAARTRLTASREAVGLLGVLVAAALPTVLASGSTQSAQTGLGLARFSWLFPSVALKRMSDGRFKTDRRFPLRLGRC